MSRTYAPISDAIRKHWGTMRACQIAELCGSTARVVRTLAADMGMPMTGITAPPQALPSRPKGITPAQIRWAKRHKTDPQSPYILGMAADGVLMVSR